MKLFALCFLTSAHAVTLHSRYRAGVTELEDPKFPCSPPAAEYLHFPQLTCKVVEENMVDGYLFVTFANAAALPLAKSWAHNLRRALGVDEKTGKGPLLAAMESGAKEGAAKLWIDERFRLPAFLLGDALPTGAIAWSGTEFNRLGQEKVRLIQQLVQMGSFRFTLADADAFWVANPVPYFDRFPDVDMLASTDNLATPFLSEVEPQHFVRNPDTLDQDPTGLVKDAEGQINIGVLMFRGGSEGIKLLASTWLRMLDSGTVWDQAALNELLQRHWERSTYDQDRNIVSSRGVRWGLLNPMQFTGGQGYWIAKAHVKLGIPVYTVHADYTNGGIPGKIAKFRTAGLWKESADYYRGKFLTFDLHVPDELLVPYEDINIFHEAPDRHLELVNYQLKQIAHAAAIAHGLNRTLVIPEIKCICEYSWYAVQNTKCRYSGGSEEDLVPTAMPYHCPPDQVFQMGKLKQIPHRWSPSFFKDPQFNYENWDMITLASMKSKSMPGLTVNVNDGFFSSSPELLVGDTLSMNQIRSALAGYEDKAIVKIQGFIPDRFTGFDKKEEAEEFSRTVTGVVSSWCCSTANMADDDLKGIEYKGLERARSNWWTGGQASPMTGCVADRSVQKKTNARGKTWPKNIATGDWWGATYPVTAEEMCLRKTDQKRCKSSSRGLCKARLGLEDSQEDSQEDRDEWKKFIGNSKEEKEESEEEDKQEKAKEEDKLEQEKAKEEGQNQGEENFGKQTRTVRGGLDK